MKESIAEREFFFQMEQPTSWDERKCFRDGRMSFADRLQQLREEARLSQEELGKAIGSSGPTVHRWEKGNGGPSLKQAVDMARVLGVDLYQLAYEDPPQHQEIISDDVRAILELIDALELDRKEALRRLASPNPPPPRSPGYDPANPWVGPQRDTTERFLREKSEERQAKPTGKTSPKGTSEPRSRSKGEGESKGSEGRK